MLKKIFANFSWKKVGFYSLLLFIALMPVAQLLLHNWVAASLTAIIAAWYFGFMYGSYLTNKTNQHVIEVIKRAYDNYIRDIDVINQKTLDGVEASYKDLIEKIKEAYDTAIDDLSLTRVQEKHLSRFHDELDLILGKKTPEELRKENNVFAFPGVKVKLKGSKTPK